MSQEYDLYLQRHKANVKKGYDWLCTNMPWLFEGRPNSAWQTEFEHDASLCPMCTPERAVPSAPP